MSDLAQVDPSQWPTSPAVHTIDIPNLGRGSRQVRTSEDGKTFWCMSCDTRLDRRRMHCDEHTRERANLLQGGRLPPRRTVNGFVEVMRDANDLLELIGEATVQFQGLQLGLTPRPNSREFLRWRNTHMKLLNRFMLKSKHLKILLDEHVKPLTPSLTDPQHD